MGFITAPGCSHLKGLKVFGDFSKQRVKKVGILAAKNGQFQESGAAENSISVWRFGGKQLENPSGNGQRRSLNPQSG